MLASFELLLYFLPYIYDELSNFQKKYMILACHWFNESYIKFHGGNSDISPKIPNLVKQVRIFLHSDQKNSEYGHFLRRGRLILSIFLN